MPDVSKYPHFLVFATPLRPEIGITGATLGTKMVVDQVSGRCDVTWIELGSSGLSGAGREGRLGDIARTAKATIAGCVSLARLIGYGLRGNKPNYLYFVPSASLGGMLRDSLLRLVIMALFRDAKLVLHIHNGNYFDRQGPLKKLLRKFVIRRADRILILSRRLLPLDREFSSVNRNKIWIVPNTIDKELIPESNQVSAKRGDEAASISVLFFSNFIKEKGHWCLLEAGALLVERGLEARFRLSFHGKWLSERDREAFQARAREIARSGLEIDIGGSVGDRRQAQSIYAAHDVFCLPTSYSAEAQPRTVLEAMANGCAIVATDYRSIPDMVVDGRNGILIARRDPHMLADALQALTERDLAEMQAESRRLFEERFSPESVRDRLYQGLRLC